MIALRFDHVVYAVGDLDAAGARILEEHGLGSVAGGRHPGWGTANRIVPLGPDYLELVAVVELAEAEGSDFGRAVLAAGTGLVGWAVATDDLSSIARRLGIAVAEGTRKRPDGVDLRWKLAGVAESLASGVLPFFIEWESGPELHPGRAKAEHRVEPLGIAWVEVAGDDGALRDWLGPSALPIRSSEGAPGLRAVAIDTAGGEVVLR